MQDNFNTYSLIQDYLNENLVGEERNAFEKEIATNPDLQNLVAEYSMVDVLIEKNEIATISAKLSKIHSHTIRRKNIVKGIIIGSITLLVIIAFTFLPSNEKHKEETIALVTESNKATSFIGEPTPFKIIDSMREAELSSSIKKSKENTLILSDIDSITYLKPRKKQLISEVDTLKPIKPIVTDKDIKQYNPVIPMTIDSLEKNNCTLDLSLDFIKITNSCKEKRTGSILFTKVETGYSFSIDNQRTYSKNPHFKYLEEATYFVSIKKDNCKSEVLELNLENYQCNFVIEPERFVYFEKSLTKFQDENNVEILILNRNGNLVYNKTISTSEVFIWDGKSNTNFPTPMGNYTYLIKSGKKVSTGEITIIR